MARIVYAWELGGGFGHIGAFLPLAARLRDAGHDVVFVTRDLLNAETELAARGFRYLQAPLFQGRLLGLPDPPASLAEILLRFGYFRAEHLAGLVRAWRDLFELLRPGLVVGDFSPTALLAARIAGIPAVTFGTGFCRPPPLHPLPNLRRWQPVDPRRLLGADRHILDIAGTVLRQFGAAPIAKVADLFAADEDFLCTWAELDHYPERPGARYWGAIHDAGQGVEMAWRGDRRFRVFCYLKPGYPNFEPAFESFLGLPDHEFVVFAPGLAPNLAERHSAAHVTVTTRPVRLAGLTGSCHAAVCHAGHGTVAGLLQAGIPLLLLPIHLEQHLTAWRGMELGAGLAVGDTEERPDYAGLLERLLREPRFATAARRFAKAHRADSQDKLQNAIVGRLEALTRLTGC
jgi:UDP:flavonoid glycosyltransferase YjiC (YdhE family)